MIAVLVAALLGVTSTAAAQDDASCAVYPQLCPPENPPTTTTPGTPTPVTPSGSTATTPTPGQGVADLPSQSNDTAGNGNPGSDDDGSPDDRTRQGDGTGASPRRAADAPIGVTAPGAGTGAGAGGRCWYAIIHVGDERDDIEREVEEALGEPCYVATLREPVDVEALEDQLQGSAFSGVGSDAAGRKVLSRFAIEVGGQMVTPEELSPLVRDTLYSDFEGRLQKVSGVVVTHDDADLSGTEDEVRDVVANGLLRGLREEEIPAVNGGVRPVPVVGTEFTTTKPSWITWFNARRISSVDNVDQRLGKQALAILMADGEPGAYGVKDTAKALLPKTGAQSPPVRFRTAGAVSAPAEASAGAGAATILLGGLLALTAGWTLGMAGRRTARRRLAAVRR